jgi:hypothetical protein
LPVERTVNLRNHGVHHPVHCHRDALVEHASDLSMCGNARVLVPRQAAELGAVAVGDADDHGRHPEFAGRNTL